MYEIMNRVLGELDRAPDFDAGAAIVLEALVAEARRLAEKGTSVLRSTASLRGGSSYRALATVHGDDPGDPDHWASASAWRWVVQGTPVSIDVIAGTVRPDGGVPQRQAAAAMLSADSREILRGRSVTHLYALPIFGSRQSVEGMLALEVESPTAVGGPMPLWDGLRQFALFLSRAAGPRLLALPVKRSAAGLRDELVPVVGTAMAPILDTLRRFARTDDAILLIGDTGVGKSCLAQWVHARSRRANGKMVVVDVSAVAEELFEAELFGSVKGAFTDAIDREGYIAAAQGGTLFLDELDSLPKPTQAKLLRLLETRRYRRVGDTREHTADVRFILASKSDLRAMVEKEEFREDLYHRVAQLPVTLPGLSDRRDEIAPWSRYFLDRVAKGDPVTLSASAEAELANLALPGNLRQLDFVVRRAWVLATPDDPGPFEVLGDHIRAAAASGTQSSHRVARALREAANVWVDALVAGDARLEDEASLIFREYVRVRACERLGVADGFRLLGRTQLVEGRNHQRAYKDALERVAAFDRGGAIE